MKTEFRTTEYEFTYGHGPRGTGSWAFEIKGCIGADVPAELRGIIWVPFSCTYTDARREMVRILKAKLVNASHVYVTVLT